MTHVTWYVSCVICHVSHVTSHRQPQPQTFPLLTPPPFTVGLFTKTEPKTRFLSFGTLAILTKYICAITLLHSGATESQRRKWDSKNWKQVMEILWQLTSQFYLGHWHSSSRRWQLPAGGQPEYEHQSVNTRVWTPECEPQSMNTSVNTRVWTPECDSQSMNTRIWTPECEHQSVNTRVWQPEYEHQSMNTRVWTPEYEHQIVTTRLWTPECEH